MARFFGEPIEVTVTGGRPVKFVWRGRVHRVRRVLEHWVTTRDWWREQRTGDPSWENPGEREFWRVEASPDGEVAVYELRHEPDGNAWTLSRIWD
ncbi:DUF6504 family protein [Thermomonospora umbrina]|uniref:DUF6504 domain-containing protein n=1 Tax=Thermomonospora umbrina TaxID=111806 RepID=A0A3D9SIK3_9ACTN|nr:DUF6504 family protein [Thermomonospora umbrina]REE95739.1 hypothetical protein DFJ69_1148 [Thermomonospora umbrina]